MSMLLSQLSTECAMRHSKQSSPSENHPFHASLLYVQNVTVLDTPLVHGFAIAIVLKNGVSMQWFVIIVYKVSMSLVLLHNIDY